MKAVKELFLFILLFIACLIISSSNVVSKNFGSTSINEILFYVQTNLENAKLSVIIDTIIEALPFALILAIILYLPISKIKDIKFKKIYPNKFLIKRRFSYIMIVFLISIIYSLSNIGYIDYLKYRSKHSELFENYYVSDVKLKFPKEKRNLIYIFVESLETTFFSEENGGTYEESIIPELEKLSLNNISFSNSDLLGGAYEVPGTEWSVAGLVSYTSATPILVNQERNLYGEDRFLPGLISLGDILKKEGYNLEVMMGSDASFGNRDVYFTSHGNYEIFDIFTAKEKGLLEPDYHEWWGFEDKKLYEFAKEEITRLANEDKPFNFNLITADTHFTDGYLDESCEVKYDNQYDNVYNCTSKMLNDFIKWLKKQDFYDNTSIVIVGDHLSMQENHFDGKTDRYIYNTFINSSVTTDTKNRIFTSMDIFPTVLASMNVKIEGDRIGLGTNLFSTRETIAEELGIIELKEELKKNSNYYDQYILIEE